MNQSDIVASARIAAAERGEITCEHSLLLTSDWLRLLCGFLRANRKGLQCKIKVLTKVLYIVVSYLMYGPYGSFAPTYDSSRATITKEESDLLYSTYGDDTGIHYAKR